jgi:hypothetical protein
VEGVAEVDEVVFVFGVDPFFLKVVDEEMDVFGDKGWLDWGEVDAGYCAVGVLVADWEVLVSVGSFAFWRAKPSAAPRDGRLQH